MYIFCNVWCWMAWSKPIVSPQNLQIHILVCWLLRSHFQGARCSVKISDIKKDTCSFIFRKRNVWECSGMQITQLKLHTQIFPQLTDMVIRVGSDSWVWELNVDVKLLKVPFADPCPSSTNRLLELSLICRGNMIQSGWALWVFNQKLTKCMYPLSFKSLCSIYPTSEFSFQASIHKWLAEALEDCRSDLMAQKHLTSRLVQHFLERGNGWLGWEQWEGEWPSCCCLPQHE